MATQNPDSTKPVPAHTPVPASRSEALEAELAMLEAMLPAEAERTAQPTRVDPVDDHGGAQ